MCEGIAIQLENPGVGRPCDIRKGDLVSKRARQIKIGGVEGKKGAKGEQGNESS